MSVESYFNFGETDALGNTQSQWEDIMIDESDFEYTYTGTIKATFPSTSIWSTAINVEYVCPDQLVYNVRDYCLGWTMSQANITLENEGSTMDFNEVDPGTGHACKDWGPSGNCMRITKYILTDDTYFWFTWLNYTKSDGVTKNIECGNIYYKFNWFTGPSK